MTLAVPNRRRKQAATSEPKQNAAPEAADLLAWYDRHRRVLPWRAKPGERPDPYHVWLSEIMLQQTGTKTVADYYVKFLRVWPDIGALAAAPLDDVLKAWAGLGYYARARNLHACAKAVAENHDGQFPAAEAGLRALPGIGPYTAAAIAAIAFDRKASPVDGNIERVMSRLYVVEQPLPAAKPIIQALSAALTPDTRAGDFAQAMMDLGATICTPRKPACALCPWYDPCAARRRGDPETFPVKAAKREGKLRRGAAFVVIRTDGAMLLRSRPSKGLLGGMTEVPSTDWTHAFDDAIALDHAPLPKLKWRKLVGAVNHVFTHFPLELTVYLARVPDSTPAPAGARFVPQRDVDGEALPSLMRKVIAHALSFIKLDNVS